MKGNLSLLEQKEINSEEIRKFNLETNNCNDMKKYTDLLEKAVFNVKGIEEEKGIKSLFNLGGSSLFDNQINGLNDFELVSFLVIKWLKKYINYLILIQKTELR